MNEITTICGELFDCPCLTWAREASDTFPRHHINCEYYNPADVLPINVPQYFARTPKGAVLSDDRKYRYFLWRVFDPTKRPVNFIGLNPSTADEYTDDPTIRKCIAFAKSWGYGAVLMTNIYALRSTDPKGLRGVSDPVGKANNLWLEAVANESGLIVCAWGKSTPDKGRHGQMVLSRFYTRASHLGLNNDGSPKHPLYLRGDTQPTAFKSPAITWDNDATQDGVLSSSL